MTRKKRRVMLVVVALGTLKLFYQMIAFTYKPPVRNTTKAPIFFFQCSFKVPNSGSGIIMMTTSKAVFTADVVTEKVLTSMHFLGRAGFQIACIGMHWKVATRVVIVAEIATQPIVVQAMNRSQGAMKIRRYRRRTEILAKASGVA